MKIEPIFPTSAKRRYLTGSIAALLLISSCLAEAAPFTVGAGVTDPTAKTLAAGETGTVEATGTLTVSGATVGINLTGVGLTTINNSGNLFQTGAGRAIDNTGGGNSGTISINNFATGIIRTANADVIRVNRSDSNVTLQNSGQIISLNSSAGGNQAIDWAAITTGANTLTNLAGGVIRATAADAVRPGANGVVNNFGLIEALSVQDAGNASGSDGVQADLSGVTIDNRGTINGRHAITGGGNIFTITVTNRTGGAITGVNGSGVNIDGLTTTSTALVNNEAGATITGTTDALSANGDGDAVDVDGVLTLNNFGIIRGLGAKGVDSGGLDNSSEGVAAGGGTINNFAGGVISGQALTGNPAREGRGILIDDGSGTSAVAATSVTNAGTIRGFSGFAIKMVGNFADTIENQTGGIIRGAGTGAAIQMGDGADQLTNSGLIQGENGLAVDLGDGADMLLLTGGAAAVLGKIDGGTGLNSATFNPGAGQSFSFSSELTNFNSVNINSGTVTFSGLNTNLTQTTINGGTLRTQNTAALGGGSVTINTGTLAITGALSATAATWNGGTIQLAPGQGDVLNVTNALTKGAGGGDFIFDTAGMTNGTFTLATFATTTFTLASQFTFQTLNANVQLTGQFFLNAGNVQFTITNTAATGPVINNNTPGGTPLSADFTVSGPVQTAGGDNTINSLAFTAGSSLTVNNTLFVTTGPVVLMPTSSVQLAGTLSASQLNVVFGSTLSGNGGISGNLVNSGLVSPGNSPGTITVSGNYTQTATGTLRIEVGGRQAGQYDLLAVGGTARLDGRLELVRLEGFELERGDRIKFLTAAGGVDGEFASVSSEFVSDTILQPTVTYEEQAVVLELVRGSFQEYAQDWGLSPNQRAVASTLDRVATDAPENRALVYLDKRKLSELPGDFDRIAPEELTAALTISTSLANVQGFNLQRRADDLRSGASGFSASGLAMQGTGPGYSGGLFGGGVAGPTGDGKEVKESKEVVVAEEKKWGVFLTGTGEWVDVDGDGNARGYDITTGGFTLGLDYKVSPNFAVGLAAGYAGTSADLTEDGRIWVNGGKLGVYATTFVGGWYADAAVMAGINSYDTKRSALQGTARGDTDGYEINVLIGTGYDWKIGALSLGPTATFQYTSVELDGFTEHGSLAPLDIADQDGESVRSALGFKASYDWRVGGVIVKPEIRAAWQHEYGDPAAALSASFADGAGAEFSVRGPRLGRDSALLGAGVAVQLSATCSTYLYYDAELGRDRYERHSISGGLRVAF